MKEGYLQQKIAELSNKIQDFDQRIKLEEKNLERLQTHLGGFKQLLKKLKEIEDFKNDSLSKIIDENKKQLDEIIKSLNFKNEKNLKKILDDKALIINSTIKQIKKDEEVFNKQIESFQNLENKLIFLTEFHRLFILKLINKGILNNRELDEINKRASKKM